MPSEMLARTSVHPRRSAARAARACRTGRDADTLELVAPAGVARGSAIVVVGRVATLELVDHLAEILAHVVAELVPHLAHPARHALGIALVHVAERRVAREVVEPVVLRSHHRKARHEAR